MYYMPFALKYQHNARKMTKKECNVKLTGTVNMKKYKTTIKVKAVK